MPFVLASGRPPRWIAPSREAARTHRVRGVRERRGPVRLRPRGGRRGARAAAARAAPRHRARARQGAARLPAGRRARQHRRRPRHAQLRDRAGLPQPVGRRRRPHRRRAPRCSGTRRSSCWSATAGCRPRRWPTRSTRCSTGDVDVTYSSSGGLVELSAHGITKATGLADVAERLDVDAGQVIAFGDMPNDVEMLRWAGHGVAMENGHPKRSRWPTRSPARPATTASRRSSSAGSELLVS